MGKRGLKVIRFKKIDKENYMECIMLKVNEHQRNFVADNAQSLLDAHYLGGLETLGIYDNETMIGFILYDFDEDLKGWSISRFMIDKEYQGRGLGKAALKAFLEYFDSSVGESPLYACVNIENKNTIELFKKFEFSFVEEIEYTFLEKVFREAKLKREC